MNNPKQSLYHPDIVAFAREPMHWRQVHDAQFVIKAYNPVCGDKFEIRCDAGMAIDDISFFGYGCLVSKASIELLCTMIIGQELHMAKEMITRHLMSLNGVDHDSGFDIRIEPFLAARKFPGRIQCATLGWEAIMKSDLFTTLDQK